MKTNFRILTNLFVFLIFLLPSIIEAKLKVITTTEDFASIAKEIGKELVDVESLTTGNTDLHFVPAQPNYILKLNRADVFIPVGLDLEVGWVPRILSQARNTKIMLGQPGYCVAYQGVDILLPQQQEINRSMGDLHAQGNPHYWPDPINGIIVAKNIRDTFVRVDPNNEKKYNKNLANFEKKVKQILIKNMKLLKNFKGTNIVSYHQEFDYLVNRYGMNIIDNIEERPGVLPGPARRKFMVDFIKNNNIKIILVSPWSNISVSRMIATESGAKLVILPIQTGSAKTVKTYLKMVDYTANLLYKNL